MYKEEVIRRLRAKEAELRRLGIARLSLFGSVARGEATCESDVDLAAELDRSKTITVFDFLALREFMAGLLERRVDLLSEPARNPRIGAEVERDRVLVF